jgi:hypothetical protein
MSMLPVPSKKSESKRQVQFVGICADAVRLGVSREHLYRVLIGERTSKSLLKRYQELKAQGEQPPTEEPAATPAVTTAPAPVSTGPQSTARRSDAAGRGIKKSNLNSKGKP